MPRSGGVYGLPAPPNPFVPGTLAMAEDVNATFTDIANALTASVATDGSTAPSTPPTYSADPTAAMQAATKHYVDTQFTSITTNYLPINGSVAMTGALTLSSSSPGAALQAASKGYVDGQVGTRLPTSGGTVTGALTVQGATTVQSTLTVTGVTTLQSALNVSGAASFGSLGANLNATGHDITGVNTLGANNVSVGALSASTINVSSSISTFAVGANGIQYQGFGGGNHIAFGWNSATTDVYVDGTHVGNIPFSPSDGRLKTVLGPYARGLADLLRVRPVRFSFNEAPFDTAREHVGVVAQEIEPLIPEAVQTRDGTKHMANDSVLWALVNAVQELAAEVATLKARLPA